MAASTLGGRERERERETERQRDRETETETERQRERDRDTETDRQTDRQTTACGSSGPPHPYDQNGWCVNTFTELQLCCISWLFTWVQTDSASGTVRWG